VTEQVPSDELSRLKQQATVMIERTSGVSYRSIGVEAEMILALVECAEALRDLYDEQNGPPLERRAQQWHNANGRASTALAKLEAL